MRMSQRDCHAASPRDRCYYHRWCPNGRLCRIHISINPYNVALIYQFYFISTNLCFSLLLLTFSTVALGAYLKYFNKVFSNLSPRNSPSISNILPSAPTSITFGIPITSNFSVIFSPSL